MTQVISTFCVTLLHSLWQAALLAGFYQAFRSSSLRKSHPAEKRSALLILLVTQLLLSVATFALIFGGAPSVSNSTLGEMLLNGSSNILYNLVFCAYCLAVMYKCFFLSRQWMRFRTRTADKIKAPLDIRLFVTVRSQHLGIRRKVSIWLSGQISSPLTYGWLKPVILLPVALVNRLSQDEIETLIMHELAHISARDFSWNFLVVASDVLFFFNPFVAFLTRELKAEREKNCDMNVLQFKHSPLIYAGSLLKTARFQNSLPGFALAAVTQKSALMERIKLITAEDTPHSGKSGNPGMFAFLALIVMAVGLFGVSYLKPSEKTVVANLKSSYAPNEVFSFVKEAGIAEKTPVIPANNPVLNKTHTPETCKPAKQKSPSESNNLPPTPVFVKADEPTFLNNNFFTMPVTSKELIEKDVEITEENPQTGEVTTTGVRMTWTDSGWVAEPLWQTKLKKDEKQGETTKDSQGKNVLVPFHEVQ